MTELMEAPTTNGREPPPMPSEPRLASPDRQPAFSPPQLAIGAAVIAALLLVGFRRLRRRGR